MHHRTNSTLYKLLIRRCIRIFSTIFIISGFSVGYLQAASPYLAGDTTKQTKTDLSQTTQIRFLTGTDFAPFNTLTSEGRLSGYHVDLIHALCQELKATNRCQIEARPWDELIPALQNNEADALIAGITPDREKRGAFSFTRPYISLPARFVAAKATQLNQPDFSPNTKNIGVMAGTVHEALLKTYFPEAKERPYTNAALMYEDLKTGKLQLIFGDAMSIASWINQASNENSSAAIQDSSCCEFVGGAYPAPEFLGQGMTIALRKKDNDLLNAVNNALNMLEQKGVLNDLYLRYFPVNFY